MRSIGAASVVKCCKANCIFKIGPMIAVLRYRRSKMSYTDFQRYLTCVIREAVYMRQATNKTRLRGLRLAGLMVCSKAFCAVYGIGHARIDRRIKDVLGDVPCVFFNPATVACLDFSAPAYVRRYGTPQKERR